MIVVDTNIIAHFWLQTDETELCEKLFKAEPNWVIPLLWKSEFRNIVVLYRRKNLMDFPTAAAIIEKAEQHLNGYEYYVHSLQVLHLAEESSCSAYDCEFVSLAMESNCKLATFNKQILHAFPDVALHPQKIIENAQPPD